MTREVCNSCGRSRPDYIADPTCQNGGYCEWRDVKPVLDAQPWIEQVVAALNRPHTAVYTATRVSDMLEQGDAPGRNERNTSVVQAAAMALDVPVAMDDRIVDVAIRRKAYILGLRP